MFRFVTLRAPQVPAEHETNAIEIYELAGGSTDLLADVTKLALEGGDRVKLAARASRHTPPTAFPLDVDKLERWFARSHHVLTSEDIATAVRELFRVEPAELVPVHSGSDRLVRG